MQNTDESTATASDAAGELVQGEMIPPAEGPDDTLSDWADTMRDRAERAGVRSVLPVLPTPPADVSEKQVAECLHAIRRFHRGDPGEAGALRTPGDDCIPALLHPFRDAGAVRHEYPLFLRPLDSVEDDRLFIPLSDLLSEVVDRMAPESEDARILKDNLHRLERHVREAIRSVDAPVSASEAIDQAGQSTVDELALSEEGAGQLRDDLARLQDAMPRGGRLLALGMHAPLHLFLHAARHRAIPRRAALRDKVSDLRTKLHDLLLIELGKTPEGRQVGVMLRMVGTAGASHVDPAALAHVLGPSRGVMPMDPDRRRRVVNGIGLFEKFLAREDQSLLIVVHHERTPAESSADDVEWRQAGDEAACAAAAEVFDRVAEHYARLFGAMRVAELELANAYEPLRHDPLLEAFDWEAFSREELLSLPPILATESVEHMGGSGMLCLSRVLLSARPIDVIVSVRAAMNVGLPSEGDPLLGYRFELGYMGVSHREALVNQSSAARPEHLLDGFLRSLDATRTSLHVAASGLLMDGEHPPLGTYLHGGAAIEGRAHPFFHYNPEAGTSWARRLDFSGNPQADEDWPVYDLPCRTPAGEEQVMTVAFTFADFGLAEPRYRDHYRVIPPACCGDEFITVDAYLALPADEALSRVPYVWAIDGDGQLHRLVITRRLAFACRDRLRYWRTLQELAGVRSEYVRAAVEQERERLTAEAEAQRQQLEEAHAAEIETVRSEAASEVMERLAQSLLGVDVNQLAPLAGAYGAPGIAPASPDAAQAQADDAEQAQAPAESETDDDDGPDEPWITSILCTTCNDCMDINPQVFVYNASKQAVIGDARAGTFDQIVRAAEKCPSRCIHPGKPLNPDEPKLDELIARAKPFN
ncbi:MAG: ferredoxin [Phycisphaerales bacterium]|nr:ferredoxin [Phycisphaerales bacterium]